MVRRHFNHYPYCLDGLVLNVYKVLRWDACICLVYFCSSWVGLWKGATVKGFRRCNCLDHYLYEWNKLVPILFTIALTTRDQQHIDAHIKGKTRY